jgi:hypothetical protein
MHQERLDLLKFMKFSYTYSCFSSTPSNK